VSEALRFYWDKKTWMAPCREGPRFAGILVLYDIGWTEVPPATLGGFSWFGALFARPRKLCKEFSENTRRLLGHP